VTQERVGDKKGKFQYPQTGFDISASACVPFLTILYIFLSYAVIYYSPRLNTILRSQ